MKKVWFDEAWEDYLYWQTQDKLTIKILEGVQASAHSFLITEKNAQAYCMRILAR